MTTTAIIIPHDLPAPSIEIIPITLAAQAEAVLAEAAITKITDEVTFDAANKLAVTLHQLDKGIESHSETIRKPLNALLKAVRDRLTSFHTPVSEAKKSLLKKIADYQREQQQKAEAARRAAEEEARKEREKAEAERARLQAEVDAKHAADVAAAKAKADQEAKELAELLGTPVEAKPVEIAPTPVVEAVKIHIPEVMVDAPKSSAVQMRKVKKVEITNAAAVPVSMGGIEIRPINMAKLREALDAGMVLQGARLIRGGRGCHGSGSPVKTAADFIRPSSLHAIAACPGRPTMEAAAVNLYGEPESSPEASMGTKAHDYVANAIKGWVLSLETGEVGAIWEDAIRLTCEEAINDGMDHWTVWCIRSCIEFAAELIAKHGIEADNVLVEHPLEMLGLGMEKPGTADLVLIIPFKLVIIVDWKFTFLDQGDASEHDQLQAYGTAGAASFKTNDVLVYLFQPRAEKLKRATGAKFDAKALAANAAWTRAVVARAKQPNPELVPSYDACLYCRALTRCAAAQEFIVNAQEAIALIGQPTDPDAWGQLAASAKIAEKFADDGKEQVKHHLIKGGSATGWGLGSGRQIRSCNNTPEALRRLAAAGMESFVREAITLSIAKLPDEAVTVIADLVQEKPTAPSLKAVKSKAA